MNRKRHPTGHIRRIEPTHAPIALYPPNLEALKLNLPRILLTSDNETVGVHGFVSILTQAFDHRIRRQLILRVDQHLVLSLMA